MNRHTFIKLFRYGVLFPLDGLRAVPAFLAALVLAPLRLWLAQERAAMMTTWVVTRLFAWRRLGVADAAALTAIVGKARVGIVRAVLGFFQWPASSERRVLGFSANAAHHRARLELVRTALPAGRVVLDLGGSCGGIPEGGLLHMGYPHGPEKVVVVDIPPDIQFWKHAAPPAELRHGPTTVCYQYTGMNDLSAFADGSIDGAWGGQCIEHVPRAVAQRTMAEVLRVLRPGGWFCLDTPNRALTRLLVRVGYIHPEHFAEYFPAELAALLQENGFEVRRRLAVSALPVSRRLGRFWKHEVAHGALLGADPDDGFSFFIEARKPTA